MIRHADAYAGFDGVISGPRGCRGITELGQRQANALRTYLADTGRTRPDVLLTSVLPRAIETAQLIAPALGLEEIRQQCSLCEIHTGEADGLAWTEYAARYGSFDMEEEPERIFAPGGESWTTFHRRVHAMCLQIAAEFAGQTVVAVCHAGVIMASVRVLFGIPHPGTGARLQPTNTGLTEWEYREESDRWTLRSYNEHAHLFGLDRLDSVPISDGRAKGERLARSKHDDEDFSRASAQKAAERDELGDWVRRFLASPGSDNPILAEQLTEELSWWTGPVEVSFDRLRRLAGPPTDPVLCPVDEEYWDDRVEQMDDLAEKGWEPSPVVVAYRDGQLTLEDGNHRVEALRQAGRRKAWAVVGFARREDRDKFGTEVG